MNEESLKEFLNNNPQAIVDLREAAKLVPQRKYGRLSRALEKYADEIAGDETDAISKDEKYWPVTSIATCINDVCSHTLDHQEKESGFVGVPSGYMGLDRIVYGFQAGELIVVASPPSAGKTAFVTGMARNMAVDYHIPVAFFTTEMSTERLTARLLVSESGLPIEKIRGAKKMTQADWTCMHAAVLDLGRAPIFVDDTPGLPIYEFVANARDLVVRHHVKAIFVDGMQMMEGPARFREGREQEVTAICRILKNTAMELQVPIIVTSQINRNVDSRSSSARPQLSDLRESGAIEQIADVVMFIHRPEILSATNDYGFPGETDLIMAKYRDGKAMDIKMRFLKSEVRFVDYNEPASYTESQMNAFVETEN